MNTTEVKKLMQHLQGVYPDYAGYRSEEILVLQISSWSKILAPYDMKQIATATAVYVKNNKFHPKPSDLIELVDQIFDDGSYPNEAEAWAYVKASIVDYRNRLTDFMQAWDNFTPEIKRALGDEYMIVDWSRISDTELDTVIASNFQRTYRSVLSEAKLKQQIAKAIGDGEHYLPESK